MPQRKSVSKKMLHMGEGYSRMLQSYNNEIFSMDGSSNNDAYSEKEEIMPIYDPFLKTIDIDLDLDPKGIDFVRCKKLPHIRSSLNLKPFEGFHK
jgi:hypothetical protein